MKQRAPLYSSAALALDIMAIAESPLFAFRARLAHELGLLTPLLTGRKGEVDRLSSELLSNLSAGQYRLRRLAQDLLDIPAEEQAPNGDKTPVAYPSAPKDEEN